MSTIIRTISEYLLSFSDTSGGGPPPGTPGALKFNNKVNSMFVPLIATFGS